MFKLRSAVLKKGDAYGIIAWLNLSPRSGGEGDIQPSEPLDNRHGVTVEADTSFPGGEGIERDEEEGRALVHHHHRDAGRNHQAVPPPCATKQRRSDIQTIDWKQGVGLTYKNVRRLAAVTKLSSLPDSGGNPKLAPTGARQTIDKIDASNQLKERSRAHSSNKKASSSNH